MRVSKAVLWFALGAVLMCGTAASDEPMKIGVVDLEQAINATSEGKAAREELERKKKDAEGQLQPLIDSLKSMQQELESKKFVLSDEALQQKRLDYAAKANELDSRGRELEGRLKVDTERIVGPLQKKLIGVVQQVGKEQGFTLILSRNASGLIYNREALDITDLVVQKFNKKG